MAKSEALKELEKMANERKTFLHPNLPTYAVPMTKYRDDNTNDIQTAIIDYIDMIGGWATRINTMGLYVEKLGRHIPSSTKRGTPDIIGCLPTGQFIGIECKQPKEALRTAQDDVRQEILSAGGIHLVAYVGSFQAIYDRIQALINRRTKAEITCQ